MKVVAGFLRKSLRNSCPETLSQSWNQHYKHIALGNEYRYGRSPLCLTFPGKVVAIRGDSASVDYGPDGIRENVNISLVKPQIGNYVLVQGGFAIRLLSNKEAEEALETWKIIHELQGN
jgi:hydrogenase assembly chaperone HypC/HupF